MAKRERLQFWLVWLALGVLPLFLRPLWEPDEARYAEIPREMLASGDWLTPRLNHVLYFEKPPFQYWLSAGSMRLLGVSAGAAKLPLVLASLATLWAAGRLARRLGAASPVWASFMAASGLLGYVCGQVLTLDALFSALWMVAVTALVEAVHVRLDRGQDLPWILLGHGSLALAMLTKGLLAPVLVAGTVAVSLAFAWREEPLRRAVLRSAFHPLGLLVLFGISVPWFVLVEQRNSGHSHFYFIHEHLERFTTHVHHRQGSTNPILDKLYFFGVLAGGLLPWVSASMVGLARSLRFLRPRDPRPSDTAARARWTAGLLLAAIGVPLLFFTFSGSKLPTYILPTVVPFAALAAAFETSHGVVGATLRRAGWELALLGTLVLVMLPLVIKDGPALLITVDPGAGVWMIALGLGFLLLALWAWFPRGLTAGRWMAAHAAVLVCFTLGLQRVGAPRKTGDHFVRQAPANAQWISHGNYWQGLAFYARQRITVIDGTGELRFGAERLPEAERSRWFQDDPLALNAVAERPRREDPSRPVWAVLARRSWKTLPETDKARWEEVARTPSSHLARFRD